MSVFRTIRGAFDNVQHDISESFKSITTKTAKVKQAKPTKLDGVDLDAGADLLNKFQEQWEHIHIESEGNAKRAQEVDIRVSGLFVQCEHQNESLNHLMSLVASLPQLLNEISEVSRKIEQLEEEFHHVSDGISELQNLNEEIELAQNKNHHKQQLHLYKERKNKELEESKVLMAEEHARKARGYEAKLQEKIQERQQVFEEAFKEEMENYKRHGKTQMKPQLTNTVAEDLADITVEEDKDKGALDEFLKSDDVEAEVKNATDEVLLSEDEGCGGSEPLVISDEDIPGEIPTHENSDAMRSNDGLETTSNPTDGIVNLTATKRPEDLNFEQAQM